jgi:hypothetical protein
MSEEKKDAPIDGGLMGKRKSQLREEVEEALHKKGISVERRISVINLETKEAHYFDDYVQAMQFLKGKKGRWYLATPGIRR